MRPANNKFKLFHSALPALLLLVTAVAYADQHSVDTQIAALISGLGLDQNQNTQILQDLSPLVSERLKDYGIAASDELGAGQWTGLLESVWSDELDGAGNIISGSMESRLASGDSTYEVYVFDSSLLGQYAGMKVSITGFKQGGKLLALEIRPI